MEKQWISEAREKPGAKRRQEALRGQRDSNSQPSDLESDALPLRHTANDQMREDMCLQQVNDLIRQPSGYDLRF